MGRRGPESTSGIYRVPATPVCGWKARRSRRKGIADSAEGEGMRRIVALVIIYAALVAFTYLVAKAGGAEFVDMCGRAALFYLFFTFAVWLVEK